MINAYVDCCLVCACILRTQFTGDYDPFDASPALWSSPVSAPLNFSSSLSAISLAVDQLLAALLV